MRIGRFANAPIWRNTDFVRLWTAGTVSMFGSFITRTALPFAAILVLHAGPLDLAWLRALEIVGGVFLGLLAGAWVDRLRRRPVMVAADLGRAVLLGSIPIAAVFGALGMTQLLVVTFVAAAMTTFFDVADRSLLPTVVDRDQLVSANSAISASESAAEFSSFAMGGFLVQLLTAPIAIAIDAVSFVISAVLITRIRRPEPPPPAVSTREPVLKEIRAGIALVASDPVLRALTAASAAAHFLWGVFGAVYLLFATKEIGLGPAAIGVIAGVGGASSFAGAVLASRTARRFGVGPSLIGGMLLFAIGNAFIPLAPSGAVAVGALFLILQQLVADSAATLSDVAETSLRQSIVEARSLGRVIATTEVASHTVMLLATILGGILAEAFGLRAAMVVGLLGGLSGALILWFSPIRTMRGGLPVAGPSATGPDALADMGHGAAAGDPPEL